jgi:hypothetical protein
MTNEQLRIIAIQDGTRKVLSGEYSNPSDYFNYFVDGSLFASVSEYSALVWARVSAMEGR